MKKYIAFFILFCMCFVEMSCFVAPNTAWTPRRSAMVRGTGKVPKDKTRSIVMWK